MSPERAQYAFVIMGVIRATNNGSIIEYRDIDLHDLRVAMSCFLEDTYLFEIGDNGKPPNPYTILNQPDWFKGVRISDAEEEKQGKGRYREVMLNRNHKKVETHDARSTISEIMGVTLLFRRCAIIVPSEKVASN